MNRRCRAKLVPGAGIRPPILSLPLAGDPVIRVYPVWRMLDILAMRSRGTRDEGRKTSWLPFRFGQGHGESRYFFSNGRTFSAHNLYPA